MTGALLAINQGKFLAHGTGNVHTHPTREHPEHLGIYFTHRPEVAIGGKLLVGGGTGQFVQHRVGSALKPV
jgi:hypothetical protein